MSAAVDRTAGRAIAHQFTDRPRIEDVEAGHTASDEVSALASTREAGEDHLQARALQRTHL